MRVASDQLHLEGPLWLLQVDSEAVEMPEDMLHSSDAIEAGWLVVHGRWYECVQRSPRGYSTGGHKSRGSILVNIWAPNSPRRHVQSPE